MNETSKKKPLNIDVFEQQSTSKENFVTFHVCESKSIFFNKYQVTSVKRNQNYVQLKDENWHTQ